ncbi:MAG: phosphoribosylformylglycinamidine cyclo-ligase, partial [Actinomycetota bacterium]|nr:phosphoribosylformylglycinamidine cyclo-ligase [Actinomycetota bacterium]
DYIACGQVVPERIAEIVGGIAHGCELAGCALVGGETAEHPGLLGPDDYDVAGAAVGVVEASALLDPSRVRSGDLVLALESSGLHSNGFSLVRHILAQRGVKYTDRLDEFGGQVGEVLLEPTRLYTAPLLRLLEDEGIGSGLHALSHVTGGGIAANLARVLPRGLWVELERSTWSPPTVFRALAAMNGAQLTGTEGTWNLGIGMLAVVKPDVADAAIERLAEDGIRTWVAGEVRDEDRDLTGFEQGAKGVDGGAVRLTGAYPD